MRYRWFRWWVLLTLPLLGGPFILGGLLFVQAYSDNLESALAFIPVFVLSVALAYSTLALSLNSTTVEINKDKIVIKHGPIPWKGESFRLINCEHFFAGRLYEARFADSGVRVRLFDGACHDLVFANSLEEAEEWAELLNHQRHLFLQSKAGRRALQEAKVAL